MEKKKRIRQDVHCFLSVSVFDYYAHFPIGCSQTVKVKQFVAKLFLLLNSYMIFLTKYSRQHDPA